MNVERGRRAEKRETLREAKIRRDTAQDARSLFTFPLLVDIRQPLDVAQILKDREAEAGIDNVPAQKKIFTRRERRLRS